MRQCLTAVMLLGCGALLSGCDILLIALADATTPEPAQWVNITWAKSRELCASFIEGSEREAQLVRGDLDAAGEHEPVPLLSPSSSQSRAASEVSRVMRDGMTYLYIPEGPIYFEEISALPPMPDTEGENFDNAIKEAWRHALVRMNTDGTRPRECEFVTRRMWFNFAI